MKVKNLWFDEDQYYREKYTKRQIVLHHTASPNDLHSRSSIFSDVNYWLSNKEKVATCCIIAGDGIIYKLFPSYFWGHHLGVKNRVFKEYNIRSINTSLNKQSIGVEIDSAGPLLKVGDKYTPATDYIKNTFYLTEDQVTTYDTPYRGYKYYQSYTKAQIESLRELLINWSDNYNIPLNYNSLMWDVSINALKGAPGLWTHTSYRIDKTDCHPQPELITMLKSLSAPKIYQPKESVVFTKKQTDQKELTNFIKKIINDYKFFRRPTSSNN